MPNNPAQFTPWSLLIAFRSQRQEIDCKMQSNSRYMLWASICAIATSVVLLASCSVFQSVIDVVPVGSLQQGVVFYLAIGNQIEAVTAGLQKVSAQVEMSRTARQMVVSDQ
jgi:hypothetical protein